MFNTVSLEATNFTMEPTEKGEESVEVANEDAGQSQPNDRTTTTFLDWFKNPLPTAPTKGYCRIEYRDPGGNTRVQHTWNGEGIVDPKLELKVKKLPDELVDQFKENAAIVEKLHLAFETYSEPVPKVLQTWIYFNLYVLRVPAHRNLRFDVLWGTRDYLLKFSPRFVPQTRCDERMPALKTHTNAFCFYWESCFGDAAFLGKRKPLPEILFSLFKDESDMHPTGVFLKDPTTSWDKVHDQVKGVAFQISSPIAERLMEIGNLQDLFSIVVKKEKNKRSKKVKETLYILTGPIMFARVSCCSPFKPYLFTATKISKIFEVAKFVSNEIPSITAEDGCYLTYKHPAYADLEAAVQTASGPEFFVNHGDQKWPVPECNGPCFLCSRSSGSDSGMVSARDVSQLEYQNQELIFGEVDASDNVKTVVQSSKQVISPDLSEAGAVLECYRVARWLSVYLLIVIL